MTVAGSDTTHLKICLEGEKGNKPQVRQTLRIAAAFFHQARETRARWISHIRGSDLSGEFADRSRFHYDSDTIVDPAISTSFAIASSQLIRFGLGGRGWTSAALEAPGFRQSPPTPATRRFRCDRAPAVLSQFDRFLRQTTEAAFHDSRKTSILSEVPTNVAAEIATAEQAIRTHVAVFDVSDRTQIEITGADRARFLNGLASNDIKSLKTGQGCETFITDLKGKVVAHVFVFCGENSLWLDGFPGQDEAILRHLGKYLLIDDVQLHSRTTERSELLVTGPLAAQLLQLEDVLAVGGHVSRETDGQAFDLRRVDLLGQPGYLISVPTSRRDTVRLGLRAVGVIEGSPTAFEALRIAAGTPKFGVDITSDNLAQEVARTKQCVSFNKGCYLGQETIARIDSLGHTNRELRRLIFESSVVPTAGSRVFDATGEIEVGTVTSATTNPAGDSPGNSSPSVLALGILKRSALSSDAPIQLDPTYGRVSGRVL